MADDEAMEPEVEVETMKIDYEAIDEKTGFKKLELQIWEALQEWIAKPEDDREPAGDPSEMESRLEWAKWFASEGPLKPNTEDARVLQGFENRCLSVVRIGIYAGQRDEYNQRNGKGKAYYSNGDLYEGQFFEGKKNGQGKYVSHSLGKSEVDKLIEQMVLKKPEDQRIFHDGFWRVVPALHEAFVNEVCSRLAVGEEIVRTALEYGFLPCYHGEYLNGLRNGDGLMKNSDGSVYKGEWKDGKRHGQGILYYVNGDTYSGNWQNGNKHGYGTYTFAHWQQEMKDGNVVYTFSVGGDYRGEWGEESYKEEVDGEKVAKTATGVFLEGEWRMPDGVYYEGSFNRHSIPHTRKPKPGQQMVAPSQIHFPAWHLLQKGVMKKGHWEPQNELILSAESTTDEAVGY